MEKIKDALVKAKVEHGVILQRGVLRSGKKAVKFKHVDEELNSIVYTKERHRTIKCCSFRKKSYCCSKQT